MLTTLYQLLLQSTPSSFSVHPRIILGYSPPYTYKFSTGQYTNSGGSLVTDPGIIPGLAYMSEYWPALVTDPGIILGLANMSEYWPAH